MNKTYKIKPLDWVYDKKERICISKDPFLQMLICKDNIWGRWILVRSLSDKGIQYTTLTEAKKAAEEWYYNKLKEALIEVNDT